MSENQIVDEVEGEEVEATEVVETDAQDTDGAEESDKYAELSHEDAIERLKKAEALIVKNKKSDKVGKPEAEPKPISKESEATRIERIELRQDGYPDEIIDDIIKLGGKDALANPIVKESADRLLKQHKAKVAGRIASDTNSTSVTKYSKEELANMSVEELDKILPHAN